MRIRKPRRGFTLLEMMAVLAVLLILGAIIIPSTFALSGNARQKAGADAVRGRLADGRALAMETGLQYRVAISSDKTKVRVAQDDGFADAVASPHWSATAKAIETTFEKDVTAEVVSDGDDASPAADQGWTTVVTFLPDGTCREDRATVQVREGDFPPIKILVRGVTGGSRTLPQTQGSGK